MRIALGGVSTWATRGVEGTQRRGSSHVSCRMKGNLKCWYLKDVWNFRRVEIESEGDCVRGCETAKCSSRWREKPRRFVPVPLCIWRPDNPFNCTHIPSGLRSSWTASGPFVKVVFVTEDSWWLGGKFGGRVSVLLLERPYYILLGTPGLIKPSNQLY